MDNSERYLRLDRIGWKLVQALHHNARLSYTDLARQVGLSVPSVIERIRKLEDAGFITGYHARINPAALGSWTKALVRFEGTSQQMLEVAHAIQNVPEVIHAHRMTGDTCFAAMVLVESTSHLEALLDRLGRYGQTRSSIIVSTPVEDGEFKALLHQLSEHKENQSTF